MIYRRNAISKSMNKYVISKKKDNKKRANIANNKRTEESLMRDKGTTLKDSVQLLRNIFGVPDYLEEV